MWKRTRSRGAELVGRLPVLGSAHPLRRDANRTLYRATVIVALIYCLGPAAALVSELREDGSAPPIVLVESARRDTIKFIPVPPELDASRVGAESYRPSLDAPEYGFLEPVPDFQASQISMPSLEQVREMFAPDPAIAFDPRRDTIVVSIDEGSGLPSPEEFIPFEEPPLLVSLPAPVYPEIARSAGMEGTVVIRALIGPKGNVLDAFVVDGHEMLRDAALASALGATYRPAQQQHHPVAVWVVQKITFRLH